MGSLQSLMTTYLYTLTNVPGMESSLVYLDAILDMIQTYTANMGKCLSSWSTIGTGRYVTVMGILIAISRIHPPTWVDNTIIMGPYFESGLTNASTDTDILILGPQKHMLQYGLVKPLSWLNVVAAAEQAQPVV